MKIKFKFHPSNNQKSSKVCVIFSTLHVRNPNRSTVEHPRLLAAPLSKRLKHWQNFPCKSSSRDLIFSYFSCGGRGAWNVKMYSIIFDTLTTMNFERAKCNKNTRSQVCRETWERLTNVLLLLTFMEMWRQINKVFDCKARCTGRRIVRRISTVLVKYWHKSLTYKIVLPSPM